MIFRTNPQEKKKINSRGIVIIVCKTTSPLLPPTISIYKRHPFVLA
jgi:hypothetical protein